MRVIIEYYVILPITILHNIAENRFIGPVDRCKDQNNV